MTAIAAIASMESPRNAAPQPTAMTATRSNAIPPVVLAFTTMKKGSNKHGGLTSESEMSYNDDKYRIPDMAYYTKAQTKSAANGEHTISPFVIEILSDTDLAKNIENKLWEYFEQGVQVVWHIMPYRELVKVFTSPRDVKICLAEDICSAKPSLENFEISVNQVFELV